MISAGLSFRAMALRARNLGGRPAYDPYDHRRDLYIRAAPLFRTFGYRQVTMKALAHACGVSAPALYRYFPTKLDFALFPLEVPPTGYCATILRRVAAAHADPLIALRAALESALADIDLLVLAIRLRIEAGRDSPDPFLTHDFESPAAVIADIIRLCVPGIGDRAGDLAHTLASLFIAAGATDRELPREVAWRQTITVLRAYLVEAGVDRQRFDEVFASEGS